MKAKKFLIKGITLEGKTFRPSDWIDRLCSLAADFNHNHRLVFSSHLYPVMVENKRCLLVNEELSQHFPDMYKHVMNFVALNRLTCVEADADVSNEIENP